MSHTYEVMAAHRETGWEKRLRLTASSEDAAVDAASGAGFLVQSVTRLPNTGTDSKADRDLQLALTREPPPSGAALISIVFGLGAWLVVALGFLVLLAGGTLDGIAALLLVLIGVVMLGVAQVASLRSDLATLRIVQQEQLRLSLRAAEHPEAR